MSRKSGRRSHGQIRRSQLITTFGPGAMLDLPNYSVLVGGLENWSTGGDEITEARLVEKLSRLLDVPTLKLYFPPSDQDDPTSPPTGITVWQFPEWFITQDVEPTEEDSASRSRMLVHRNRLSKNKFIDRDKRRRDVVPVRFVRACRAGHMGTWRKSGSVANAGNSGVWEMRLPYPRQRRWGFVTARGLGWVRTPGNRVGSRTDS